MAEDWSMNKMSIKNGHKPYDPDSEWQPVRIAPNDSTAAHPLCIGPRSHLWNAWAGKIIRVRPTEYPVGMEWQYADLVGCKSTRYYDVHPDDLKVFLPVRAPSMHLCEHQILAD